MEILIRYKFLLIALIVITVGTLSEGIFEIRLFNLRKKWKYGLINDEELKRLRELIMGDYEHCDLFLLKKIEEQFRRRDIFL